MNETWIETCCFIKHNDLRIKQYRYWSWALNPDQDPFIGRSIIYLNHHLEKWEETSSLERAELFRIYKEFTGIIHGLFQPDLINQAQMGNNPNFRHLHWHLVPRYQSPRTFSGKTYQDTYWGDSFDLHDSSVQTSPQDNVRVAQAFRTKLF